MSADYPPDVRECDALVIGAGPAGSAAAAVLARAGADVVLIDRSAFPRDKVCGDALIADAQAALHALGLGADVLPAAHTVHEIRIYAPDRTAVSLRGRFACLPRAVLDDRVRQHAVDRGAAFVANVRRVEPLIDGGRVAGASFAAGQRHVRVRARITILATGADAGMLRQFGVAVEAQAAGTAVRTYVTAPAADATDHLVIAYERSLCPGYGWIFPCPGGTFNVGVGVVNASKRMNLRTMWEDFTRDFPPAKALLAHAVEVSPLRGAPLRTSLRGARFGRPGLLVAGEAAGTTYAATGEGIGKALESGMLAGEFAAGALNGGPPPEVVYQRYEAEILRRFGLRFRTYDQAQKWARYPWMVNLLARRVRSGRFLKGELEAMLAETGDPARLFSWGGLLRTFVS